jgi:hypothetical protein
MKSSDLLATLGTFAQIFKTGRSALLTALCQQLSGPPKQSVKKTSKNALCSKKYPHNV